METVNCPGCKRVVNIEPETPSREERNAGHGRVVDQYNRPSLLQCVCGKHIIS